MNKFDLLEIGFNAAKAAIKIIEPEKNNINKIEKNLSKDVKVFADKMSEKVIINFLNESTNFSILSEELGYIDKSSKYTWIIDPVDGSVNFSRDIPFSAISIGLWEKNKPILGIIYDINNNDVYKGIVGEGSWLNNKPIYTKIVTNVEDAIICTGFPIATDFSDHGIKDFINQIKGFKKTRLFGSASLSMAYLAKGCVDAYYEKNIKIWDVAAGIAIVIAAGGRVEFSKIDSSFKLNVKASGNLNLKY